MRKTILSVMAMLGASAFAMTDAEFNQAYQKIRSDKKNQPRYCQYKHDLILADLAKFGQENRLTDAQRVRLAGKVAEHANAKAEFRATYEKALAEVKASTNAQVRAQTLNALFDAMLHTYSFNRARGLLEAEKLLAELAPSADGRRQLNMRLKFVEVGLAVHRDRAKAKFDREYALVKAFKPDEKLNGPAKLALQKQAVVTQSAMLAALVSVDPDGAAALFAQDAAVLDAGARNTYWNAVADYAIKMKDRLQFDKVLNAMLAEPRADRIAGLYRPLVNKLHKFDADAAEKIVDRDLADKSLSPVERLFFLSIKQGFNDPPIFDYGYNKPGRYGRWRAALLERKAIAEANPNDKACAFFKQAGAISWETERMIWYDDLATAKPIVAKALELWPNDRKLREQEAQIRAIEGDAKGAADSLAKALAIKGTKEAQSNQVNRVAAFLLGQGIAGFDRVNAPLKLTSAQRLTALRATSRQLFTYRRYADCRTIFDEIVGKMYRPEERKVIVARHLPHAPQTAGAFAYSPLYADWNNYETRFLPYGGGYGESAQADEKWHLKDGERPACDPAWKTGVAVVYDDEGVHVFIRCDDPAISEVTDGQRDAGGLEMFFAPGGLDVPYHSVFFEGLPKTDDPHAADWCSPGKHYRRNTDAYKKDAALTPEGVVAHLHLPWISFYDNLPIDGKLWNLGVIRSCKGGMQTVGGIVHELSRGLQIKFELTPAQLLALKRKVSVIAYNRYRKIREGQGDFIQRWNDPLLGDPAFYAAVVAPLVERLDKAGAELTAPCADAEVERFFTEFAPLWAEIGYELAERRTQYLNDRLFAEENR